MTMKIKTPLIILCGGKSSRLGFDKSMLPFPNFLFKENSCQYLESKTYIHKLNKKNISETLKDSTIDSKNCINILEDLCCKILLRYLKQLDKINFDNLDSKNLNFQQLDIADHKYIPLFLYQYNKFLPHFENILVSIKNDEFFKRVNNFYKNLKLPPNLIFINEEKLNCNILEKLNKPCKNQEKDSKKDIDFSPLYGILSIVLYLEKHTAFNNFFILNVDMPFIKIKDFKKLHKYKNAFLKTSKSHFLASIWSIEMLNIILDSIKSRNFRLSDILDGNFYEILCNNESNFLNINTIQDYFDAMNLLRIKL